MRQAGRKAAYLIGLGGRKVFGNRLRRVFQFIVPGGLPGTVGSAGT